MIYIDLAQQHIGTGFISHRGRCNRFRTHARGWQTSPALARQTTISSRVSSSKIRTRDSLFVRRRPHGDAWASHDLRDARQVRRHSQVENIQGFASSNDCLNSATSVFSRWSTNTDRWWCSGGIVAYAASNEGQFIFALLKDFGLTPAQWRVMDPRDVAYLSSAFAERLRLEKEQREQASRRRR